MSDDSVSHLALASSTLFAILSKASWEENENGTGSEKKLFSGHFIFSQYSKPSTLQVIITTG